MCAPGEPLLLRLLLLPMSLSVLPTSERSNALDCILSWRRRDQRTTHVRTTRATQTVRQRAILPPSVGRRRPATRHRLAVAARRSTGGTRNRKPDDGASSRNADSPRGTRTRGTIGKKVAASDHRQLQHTTHLSSCPAEAPRKDKGEEGRRTRRRRRRRRRTCTRSEQQPVGRILSPADVVVHAPITAGAPSCRRYPPSSGDTVESVETRVRTRERSIAPSTAAWRRSPLRRRG